MTLLFTGGPTTLTTPPPIDTSGHRHKNSAGKWVTVIDGKHRHADLEARIAALEATVKELLAR